MTIDLQIPAVQYTGDGIQTTFSFTFTVDKGSDLLVKVDDTILQESVHYTVQNLTEAGGDIVFFIAPADEAKILIQRNTPITQQIDLEPFEAFPADTMEWGLDKLTRIIQEKHGGVQDGDGSAPNLVLSVFGRIGHVIAHVGDYIAKQILYDNSISGLAATDVQDAIDEIDQKADDHIGDVSNPHQVQHDQLLGVTPDQHHPRLHDHTDPLDGFVAHADTIGQTPNDHHNQVHVLTGPDHLGDVISGQQIDVQIVGNDYVVTTNQIGRAPFRDRM